MQDKKKKTKKAVKVGDLKPAKDAKGGKCPADRLDIEQAQLLSAEVIVMGHHHLSRLRRWANPSTCGEVIERSRCAVLIETRDKG